MNNMAICLQHGTGTRRYAAGALEQLERTVRICDVSGIHWIKTNLAKLLLCEDIGELRNLVRAVELLKEALQQIPTYGPALHELGVLYSDGDDGVPQNRERSANLYFLVVSKSSYKEILVVQANRMVIEARENYPDVVE